MPASSTASGMPSLRDGMRKMSAAARYSPRILDEAEQEYARGDIELEGEVREAVPVLAFSAYDEGEMRMARRELGEARMAVETPLFGWSSAFMNSHCEYAERSWLRASSSARASSRLLSGNGSMPLSTCASCRAGR